MKLNKTSYLRILAVIFLSGALGLIAVNFWGGDFLGNAAFLLPLIAAVFIIFLAAMLFATLSRQKKMDLLKSQNALFMDGIIDCVIICDKQGMIIEFNEMALETFGYTPEELKGKHVSKLYASGEEWQNVKAAFAADNFFKGEVINKNRKGENFISSLSANLVYDKKGQVLGSMEILRDITGQKRNEDQVSHIVNNAADIIYRTNVEGEFTYVNTSASSVLGYSNKDLLGRSFKDLVHPEYREEVERSYRKQFENRDDESYMEFKVLKANGESIWVGQNVRADFNPIDSGRIEGFFGIVRNLDDFKKAQLRLQESETKYRELFDNSKDLIQSVDGEGFFLYVNQAWKDLLGYSDEELPGMNFFDIIHLDSRDYCEEVFNEITKDETDGIREHTFKMITKSQTPITLQGTISVSYEGGMVKSIQSFLRDVTERHEMEIALQKSEENFRQISSSINDVFFLYDFKTEHYEYISPNCEEVLGVGADFFMNGNNYAEHNVVQEHRDRFDILKKRVLEGEQGHIEYKLSTDDNDEKWVDEKWFPIENSQGEVVSVTGICRDITDVKFAYDKIYEQNREISQSILYAKNIQESALATENEVKAVLPESFVFYKAKDVLSGDLFIVDFVRSDSGQNLAAFAVGDCTGHGVPGGLLSLLCSGLLTESLTRPEINSPSEALDFVREKLIRLFRSNPEKYILDGMDAAFCVLNENEDELFFAGANQSCYIVRNEEVLEYKGDRQSIGFSISMEPFVPFSIPIEKGDSIYLTTDGYIDQFGGEKKKKFLRRRFKALLLEINDLSMDQQRVAIEKRFEDWKGENEQTDDIAMIGVKI